MSKRKRNSDTIKMAASLQPISSETSILDLNDDCFKEVFAQMEPKTLTTVADVCDRLKQNTMHAARRTIKAIRLYGNPSVYEYSMLRNFGQFIEKIEVAGDNVEKRIIEYLSLYCVGKSIELRLKGSHTHTLHVTEEIVVLMRPLFGRVQELRFEQFRLGEVLLRNLPLLSAELQESEYGANKPLNGHLHQKNLKSITFRWVPDVQNDHIEAFLQQNPQLKEIELISCKSLGYFVLESIARNVSAIEKLAFVTQWKRARSNRGYIKYFCQLHRLKSLKLSVIGDNSYIQSVVHEIASVNTGLEYLNLHDFDLRLNADQFIGGISKLQQLKELILFCVKNFTAAHLIEICKHAKELSVIHVGSMDQIPTNYQILTNDHLLEIVKNARKLQLFGLSIFNHLDFSDAIQTTNIDGNTFLKLAKLVDQRDEKTNLCLELPYGFFELDIPADLLTSVNYLKIDLH